MVGADWKRQSYPGVQKWFRLVLRLGLATTMVGYGMAKFFPLQMSYPGLTRMLQPYGTFSMMGVLWTKIGASPMYEVFTGAPNCLMAILLFIPGTDDGRRAGRTRRHDADLGPEHDLRRAGEAVLVSPDADVHGAARAGRAPARQPSWS